MVAERIKIISALLLCEQRRPVVPVTFWSQDPQRAFVMIIFIDIQ